MHASVQFMYSDIHIVLPTLFLKIIKILTEWLYKVSENS